ncbi:hypothetical protein PF005_g9814 [Phytophthora fragariae]|uniref:Uncharacterized protein n=1 Tax=Phytophthora fragariae TaxID=53985 RepID=A0A6A3ULW4_9STRA|nr:hypothetical protein PF003_g13726 [Phytophthora fragariae]KAE8939133.1 hypothetical protein PF009_g11018 [Phytophthora fragariae]KAE9007001.1 hypothetical protein PF011_g11316 [Phytophthora fragariae]KAE9110463.1 hypothetical protein PF007_g11845 [Phytophthora fragariae]KAE9148042.1 hypothetical protein PF006_g7329 [Phytophthora fragariae]
MAALGMMAEAANARLLHERVEGVREQLAQLQNQEERYDAVAETLNELPDGLSHLVIAPGKIVRSNEVLAHLEDDVFSWRSATQDVEIIASKQEVLRQQLETQGENLRELEAMTTHVGSVAQRQKMYETENISEIRETEVES